MTLPVLPTLNVISTNTHWTFSHRNIFVKVVRWGEPDAPKWNYYLHIHERYLPPSLFIEWWLPSYTTQFITTSPLRETTDYFSHPISDIAVLHGGITYYEKHNYCEGCRCIEVGCDYAHLSDDAHGPYTLDEVARDAYNSAEHLANYIKNYTEPTQ